MHVLDDAMTTSCNLKHFSCLMLMLSQARFSITGILTQNVDVKNLIIQNRNRRAGSVHALA